MLIQSAGEEMLHGQLLGFTEKTCIWLASTPGTRMDADGSIVYRWNHTLRIQEETDKVEPTVYADTCIPYTAFPCGSERFRVYMVFQGFSGYALVAPY